MSYRDGLVPIRYTLSKRFNNISNELFMYVDNINAIMMMVMMMMMMMMMMTTEIV